MWYQLRIISMGSESSVINNLIYKVFDKYPNNFAFHSKIQADDYPFIKKPIIIGNGFKLDNYTFQYSVTVHWRGLGECHRRRFRRCCLCCK